MYARFLGYDVDLYERGEVAENVGRWGHVRLFSPFGMNASSLGLAALTAQDERYRPPGADELLRGKEFIDRYLLPLSQTDLLAESLHLKTEVLAISRGSLLKADCLGWEDREDPEFRLLVRDAAGKERVATADAVIDATGTYGNHNWVGAGGIPALGETAASGEIEYGLPDVLSRDRDRYAGRHTLVVGSGHSAATTVVALAELAQHDLNTRITWIVRREDVAPIPLIDDDRLPSRRQLAEQANRLAADKTIVDYRPGTLVEQIDWDAAKAEFRVGLSGNHAGELSVERVVGNVGYRADNRLWSELQVHECYASGGPMTLAAALLGNTSADCLDQRSCGPQALLNPEPDFYVLGVKSYGRSSKFLISAGLGQIRDLFTIIGDRAELDLYANMARLRG